MSTRKVEKIFSGFGLKHISASVVSLIAKKLDILVRGFLERSIEESYLYAKLLPRDFCHQSRI